MENHREQLPRTVKPRTHKPKHYPIVAIHDDYALDENAVLTPVDESFIESLPCWLPHLFVGSGIGDFVARVAARYDQDPAFQFRATAQERDIYRPGTAVRVTRVSTVIHFWGWKHRINNRYHLALDPVTFYGRGLDDVWPGDEPPIVRLMEWAKQLQEWCNGHLLLVKPTAGGVASQFLRDARFYPKDRRKVPAAINERARTHLPGNHYRLFTAQDAARPAPEYRATYLDQRRAHHYHAQNIRLPNSNSLFAYGRFLSLEDISYRSIIPGFSGLYYLRMAAPENPPAFTPYAGTGTFDAFIWSTELSILQDWGYKVQGVVAAWGSQQSDRGLAKYAAWANSQLNEYAEAPWLKPILLSTYGVLAIKPRKLESLFGKAKRGDRSILPTGRERLHGLLVSATSGRRLEPSIANVLHRGLIESATRAESLGMADYLHHRGHNVLSIYADAVIVECNDENPLPHIPEPWRTKAELNHLRFLNTQSFVSGEMTKLPGVGREILQASAGRHRRAPSRTLYDSLSGMPVATNRRI